MMKVCTVNIFKILRFVIPKFLNELISLFCESSKKKLTADIKKIKGKISKIIDGRFINVRNTGIYIELFALSKKLISSNKLIIKTIVENNIKVLKKEFINFNAIYFL